MLLQDIYRYLQVFTGIYKIFTDFKYVNHLIMTQSLQDIYEMFTGYLQDVYRLYTSNLQIYKSK